MNAFRNVFIFTYMQNGGKVNMLKISENKFHLYKNYFFYKTNKMN